MSDQQGRMWAAVADIATGVRLDDNSELSELSSTALATLARLAKESAAALTPPPPVAYLPALPVNPEPCPDGGRTKAEAEVAGKLIYGPDGIGQLYVDTATFSALNKANLLTVAQIKPKVDDGTLLGVRNIGAKRARVVCEAIAKWEAR